MKKLVLFGMLAMFVHYINAQDFAKVKTSVLLPGQLPTAKTESRHNKSIAHVS